MRVVIAAGGTAGHVIPALCVADELRAQEVDVEFIGGDRAEAELVPSAGYAFHRLNVEGISRSNPLKAARAVLKAVAALFAAWRLLGQLKPRAVMGGGGYVAGPVGLAAVVRRIPLVLTEADSHLGITNRLLARFAKRVCLAFPIAGREGGRYVVTGRPVPPVKAQRASSRAKWGFTDGDRVVVVFGGSLGARSINEAAIAAFPDNAYRVIHIAGKRDFVSLTPPVGDRYTLLEYLDHEQFGELLAAADLVVARSGGSVFELAAYGKPAVLIPYPHASADHQTENARWMADAGAAVVIQDSELTAEGLRQTVDQISTDDQLASMARESLALAHPEAAADVASEILKVKLG